MNDTQSYQSNQKQIKVVTSLNLPKPGDNISTIVINNNNNSKAPSRRTSNIQSQANQSNAYKSNKNSSMSVHDTNQSQKQEEILPANVNPFKYLYTLRYKNPSILSNQKINLDQLPQIANQNPDDFFHQKFDQYLEKASDPNFLKTSRDFTKNIFTQKINQTNGFDQTLLNTTRSFGLKANTSMKNLKQLKPLNLEQGNNTHRSAFSQQKLKIQGEGEILGKSKIDFNQLKLNLSKMKLNSLQPNDKPSSSNQVQIQTQPIQVHNHVDFNSTWRNNSQSDLHISTNLTQSKLQNQKFHETTIGGFYTSRINNNTSSQLMQSQRSMVKVELNNQNYKDWSQANLLLQNNKEFHQEMSQDLQEFQTQRYNSSVQEFSQYVHKIQDMPVIRVSKKKENKDNDDNRLGRNSAYDKGIQKSSQQKQIYFNSMITQDMKLYWEKIPAMKWSPDSREGATLLCIEQKIFLFGGLSSKLHKDTEILAANNWRWLKPQEFKVRHAPNPRYDYSAVIYFDHIIVFGGQQTYNAQTKIRNTLNDLLLFNTQTYEWEQIHYGGMFFARKQHVAAIVSHHMLLFGGQNEEGQFEGGLLALNLGTFKWMPCPVEGEDPGKLIHQTCVVVVHPERAQKKSFSLFKNPSDMKYRQFSRITHEGVYFFGGKRPDGFSSNQLHVLRVGCKPLQWFQPEIKGSPPSARYGHTMNYFEQMNCIVIFGGRNDTLFERTSNSQGNFLNDMWLLHLENMIWIHVSNIGDVPSPRYSMQSAIYGSRLVIFGGLNSKTYNNSDLYICELDPMLSKQYEAEKNRKILDIKNQLARNKYSQGTNGMASGDEAQSQTAQILQKFFGERLKNSKMPLPLNLINYLENRHQQIEKQRIYERESQKNLKIYTGLSKHQIADSPNLNLKSPPNYNTTNQSEILQQFVASAGVSRIEEDQEDEGDSKRSLLDVAQSSGLSPLQNERNDGEYIYNYGARGLRDHDDKIIDIRNEQPDFDIKDSSFEEAESFTVQKSQ